MYSMLCHSGFDYTVCSNSLHLLLSILLEYVKTPIYWSILTIMLSIVPVLILTCSSSAQFLKCDKGISGFGFWLTSNLFSVFRVYVRCWIRPDASLVGLKRKCDFGVLQSSLWKKQYQSLRADKHTMSPSKSSEATRCHMRCATNLISTDCIWRSCASANIASVLSLHCTARMHSCSFKHSRSWIMALWIRSEKWSVPSGIE